MFVHKGFWNCCQDRPAKAIQMDEGLYAACASCAGTYGRQNGDALVRDLPRDWTVPTWQDHAKRLAEQAHSAYKVVAYSDGPEAHCLSEIYRNARFTFLATIINAYGTELKAAGMDAEDVYNLTIDSGEDVAYCVKYALEHPEIHPFRI